MTALDDNTWAETHSWLRTPSDPTWNGNTTRYQNLLLHALSAHITADSLFMNLDEGQDEVACDKIATSAKAILALSDTINFRLTTVMLAHTLVQEPRPSTFDQDLAEAVKLCRKRTNTTETQLPNMIQDKLEEYCKLTSNTPASNRRPVFGSKYGPVTARCQSNQEDTKIELSKKNSRLLTSKTSQ